MTFRQVLPGAVLSAVSLSPCCRPSRPRSSPTSWTARGARTASFGTVIVLLSWFYLQAQVLLFGAGQRREAGPPVAAVADRAAAGSRSDLRDRRASAAGSAQPRAVVARLPGPSTPAVEDGEPSDHDEAGERHLGDASARAVAMAGACGRPWRARVSGTAGVGRCSRVDARPAAPASRPASTLPLALKPQLSSALAIGQKFG